MTIAIVRCPKPRCINRPPERPCVCVSVYLALWGLGLQPRLLSCCGKTLLGVDYRAPSSLDRSGIASPVFAEGALWECDLRRVFVAGADESDVSGDSETGSDRRGVLPQTEVGQHGGDAQQPSAGTCGYGSKKGRGKTGVCIFIELRSIDSCFYPVLKQ